MPALKSLLQARKEQISTAEVSLDDKNIAPSPGEREDIPQQGGKKIMLGKCAIITRRPATWNHAEPMTLLFENDVPLHLPFGVYHRSLLSMVGKLPKHVPGCLQMRIRDLQRGVGQWQDQDSGSRASNDSYSSVKKRSRLSRNESWAVHWQVGMVPRNICHVEGI